MRGSSFLAVFVLFTLVAPPAGAQEHEHPAADGPRILIQADLPPDGRALVGHPAHFQFVLLDKSQAPIVHQDISIEVVFNGITLFSTDSAHDYDGTGGLDIVFPTTGVYRVTVAAPGSNLEAHYVGYVVQMTGPIPAMLDEIEIPTTAVAGQEVLFRYANVDQAGTLLAHSDVRVEIRRLADDFPVLHVQTHSHENVQAFTYVFEQAGTHSVRFVGYQAFPSKSGVEFIPYVTTKIVEVSPAPTRATGTVMGVIVNAVPASSSIPAKDSHALYKTIVAGDPLSGTGYKVGPFSQVRHTVLVHDPMLDTLVQHTNHEATLTGPNGQVFHSDTLHEYDGALEFMSANQALGGYQLMVSSSRGNWTTQDVLTYSVNAADLAQGAGPQQLRATTGAPVQGEPAAFELFAGSAGVIPFMHSEVALQVVDPDTDFPLLSTKLHTHSSGLFAFTYAHAAGGAGALQADLFDIHGSPTPLYYGATPDAPTRFTYAVLAGTELPAMPTGVEETSAAPIVESSPAAPLALIGLALVALLGWGRRGHPRP